MKLFFIIFILILLYFPSCEKIKYTNIPKNEIPKFQNGDTIKFIDKKNNKIDSFLINIKSSYDVHDKNYYNERITIDYKSINNNNQINNIRIQNNIESINVSFDGYYYPTILKKDLTTNISIDSILLKAIYIRQGNDLPILYPKKIYYSITNGLMGYFYSENSYFLNDLIYILTEN